MQIHPSLSSNAPEDLRRQLASPELAEYIREKVYAGSFDIEDAMSRPGEYAVMALSTAMSTSDTVIGLAVRVVDICCAGRSAKIFHAAADQLLSILKDLVNSLGIQGFAVNIAVTLVLDGPVETAPASGDYSPLIERATTV